MPYSEAASSMPRSLPYIDLEESKYLPKDADVVELQSLVESTGNLGHIQFLKAKKIALKELLSTTVQSALVQSRFLNVAQMNTWRKRTGRAGASMASDPSQDSFWTSLETTGGEPWSFTLHSTAVSIKSVPSSILKRINGLGLDFTNCFNLQSNCVLSDFIQGLDTVQEGQYHDNHCMVSGTLSEIVFGNNLQCYPQLQVKFKIYTLLHSALIFIINSLLTFCN